MHDPLGREAGPLFHPTSNVRALAWSRVVAWCLVCAQLWNLVVLSLPFSSLA